MDDRASCDWLCTQNKPLNDSWVTVTGGDAEFIKELIASGLLGSRGTQIQAQKDTQEVLDSAHGKCRKARLSLRSIPITG